MAACTRKQNIIVWKLQQTQRFLAGSGTVDDIITHAFSVKDVFVDHTDVWE
jgi:hypothetical protein